MSKFVNVVLPLPLPQAFTYQLPENSPNLKPGCRVKVPFGKRSKIGFIQSIVEQASKEIKKIKLVEEIIDSDPIFDSLLIEFLNRAARYYHHPLGEVYATALPKALKEGRLLPQPPSEFPPMAFEKKLELSDEQQFALNAILKKLNHFHTFLLNGATGTGKTEVYLQAIEAILIQQQQALVLIPEIGLTPQTVSRFESRFGSHIGVFHSGVSDKMRLDIWSKVQSGALKIVIGTRSSLFLPFKALGIIIVDEEHDASYKQQTGFKYSARDLAIFRALYAKCPIVLGSATPSFETLYNSITHVSSCLPLTKRLNQAQFPSLHIIDVRHKKLTGGLAAPIIDSIRHHLDSQQQVLIFINRRGYAPTWMCFECQWQASCNRCQSRLTYHRIEHYLRCPQCDEAKPLINQCPECKCQDLNPIGIGTQRIEETLFSLFPDIPLTRIDSDAIRGKNKLSSLFEKINSGQPQIILGTQMLAKGHHFPQVTLACILDADGGLFSSDFRGAEKMGQLITQVAGRAGRGTVKSEVMLQTNHPDHPLLQQLMREGYLPFAHALLEERALCQLPPYSYLALLSSESTHSQNAFEFLDELKKQLLVELAHFGVVAYGPLPAPLPKRQSRYRFQLLFKSSIRKSLHQLLSIMEPKIASSKLSKKVKWSIDIDPIDLY